MGANQSSDGSASGGASTGRSGAQRRQNGSDMKTCYYELLGVDRKATDEEIKKSYRRKALELHPDRNFGNVENTTKLFAEVQSAYEVLSDPQERAWYDSHRDAILRDDTEATTEHYEHNVRITTAEDIMRMFTKINGRMDFSDSPSGFFSALRSTFETLAREEDMACEWDGLDHINYPSFGHSTDSYEEVVRPFYAAWNGFSTKKTFSWKDKYRYSDAPDRRVRRMMEKENKRSREEGIREFNDAVRSLVAFVRKRDPRYLPNTQTDAERQKSLRNAATAQAARSRAANQAKLEEHVEADWSKSRLPEDDGEGESDEVIEEEEFECVACGKTFKSERQFEAHEKSKKHLKIVRQLRRDMQKENVELGLDDVTGSGVDTPDVVLEDVDIEEQDPDIEIDGEERQDIIGANSSSFDGLDGETGREMGHTSSGVHESAGPNLKQPSNPATPQNDGSSEDEYASREKVESRFADPVGQLADDMANTSVASDSNSTPHKMGKAKEKRAKKAAQQKAATESLEHKCAACSEIFPSKTKLFIHIKEEGHAPPVPRAVKGGGKAKKR